MLHNVSKKIGNIYKKCSDLNALNNISIERFRKVDDFIYQSSKPNLQQLRELKDAGFDTVISFSENRLIDGTLDEGNILKNLGIRFFHLPFFPNNVPKKSQIDDFFEIIKKTKIKHNKLLFHCNEGKDRAGFFGALYKIKFKGENKNKCIQEMISNGHDMHKYPELTKYLRDL